MKLYKTWLNDQFTDYMFTKSLSGNTVRPGAIVKAENLEKVYEVTNNIEDLWTKNPEIQQVLTDSRRSLSVGDLVHDLDENKFYVVLSFGFDEISDEEYEAINFEVEEI